jgi:Carboxypeptidase regulatory-like domain/TonB-dependent Receptor Plug Domain
MMPVERFSRTILRGALASLVLVLALSPTAAYAQVTTGSLAGTVTSSDGAALPGVSIEAVHVPTSTSYSSMSGDNGRFAIPNVRVGGPYTLTATLDGFQTAEITGVMVGLGTATFVPIDLAIATVAETISVTSTAALLDSSQTGSTSMVSTEDITSLPTVNRSIQDFARLNPLFNVDTGDATSTRFSVSGRNNRYNTIQIDGAVNNDLFGLADTGTPGGQADTQPISLDAIQEIQMVVSPYDVRQSGFTGGGVNAVTRSGSNDFEGSVFLTQRDEGFVGDGPFDNPVANFSQDQYGGRIGGRLVRDKAFFFLSGEINRREEPTGWSADGSTGNQYDGNVDLSALRSFLMSSYGYDPGSLGDFNAATDNDLVLGKIDWIVNESNNLSARHNYVSASRDVPGTRRSTTFTFPTATYAIADETNSTVLQLNSVLDATKFNEARVGLQTIRDERAVPIQFPTVEIGGTGARNGAALVGTERFSGANSLDQDILEITDDFTWLRGDHTFVFGTHNEFFEFKNLFMSEALGYYYFPTLEDFEGGFASEYRITFANGSDPRRPTQFKAAQLGLYASDTWRVSDDLSVIFGLRVDKPSFPDTPSNNPLVPPAIGFSTANTPDEGMILEPRVGFNWAIDDTQQLRGGVGIFAGRTPYVWISNAYGNTGVEQTALSCFSSSCMPLFNPDPNSQEKNLAASGGAFSVDLIDPDFELPRVMRTTLGYDRELPWNMRGSAEVVFSQTVKDVFYYNQNRVQNGSSPLDGRPTYTTISGDIRDAIELSNTGKGDSTTVTLQASRPFTNGFAMSGFYAYQDATSAFDATSSRAISNWQFRPTKGDIFAQDTFTSTFQVEDRFNIAGSYTFSTGPVDHTVGLVYNVESGRPYSLLMGGDPNTDGLTSNDLLYVPSSADQIILQDSSGNVIDYGVFADFLAAAGVDATAGRIVSANESLAPWTHQMDFHYELGLPISKTRASVTFDIINFLNMLDSNNGVMRYVAFSTNTPVTYRGIDSATGKPIYRANSSTALEPGHQFSTADLRSRWQARVGLRVSF